jgi:hypothetical protein
MAAQTGDHARAKSYTEQASQANRYYEEDKALLDALTTRYDPGRLPVASWRVDLAAGWTSNGLAGSPQDPADIGLDTQSALFQLDARLRIVIPTSTILRPVIEGQVRTLELFAQSVRPLSYRQPSLRPGVLIGDSHPRLLLNYGFDAVQMAGGDRYEQGPLWFSQGHRIDYELEATEYLFAFGGGGRRTYREAGRSRWEGEQGIALGLPLSDGLRLMTGASVRWYRAFNKAYDVNGATVLGQLQSRLPAGLEGRLNASFSYDDYPRSQGYFPHMTRNRRTDLQVRIKPGLWSPSWSGVRVGLDWEYSHRSSTAKDYDFGDNRVLLHGVWVMDWERIRVQSIPAEGREPLPHGVAASGQLEDDVRIRDLIQQDEAVKRGSSCLN